MRSILAIQCRLACSFHGLNVWEAAVTTMPDLNCVGFMCLPLRPDG